MIDVHAHILPQVDDGSDSMEETLSMLSISYAQGFRAVIATPHYIPGNNHKSTTELKEILDKVREAAKVRFPDLFLCLGQEVYYFEEVVEALRSGQVLTMAGSRYVLVEFPYESSWKFMYRSVRNLLNGGYYPIVAHVERYGALQERGRLMELKQAGVMLQMNYQSLEGSPFHHHIRWCRQQILNGAIDLLGTDCHHTMIRSPDIKKPMKWLETKCPRERIQQLVQYKAEEIIKIPGKGNERL